MGIDKKNASVNHQDHPRQEGQQNNTPPIHEYDGQRRSNNMSQPMSNMMQDSDEKKEEKRSQEDENK